MDIQSIVGLSAPILELGILFLSLYIVTSTTIVHIIAAYRWQTLLLLFTALATVFQIDIQDVSSFAPWEVFFLAAWPLILFFTIGHALFRAIISEEKLRLNDEDRMDIQRAWVNASHRQEKPTLSRTGAAMMAYLFMVVFAFVVAFRFVAPSQSSSSSLGLGVALALQFAGLFSLVTKHDLISQIVGLFVMDHGMYLAMALLIPMPAPAWAFLLALYLYTFITLLLLFFLLPNLRRIKKRIDLDALREKSSLKG